MKRILLISLIVVGLVASNSPLSARADASPPQPPPGSDLAPGESTTMVQMVWEDVLITVGDDRAFVQAMFRFQNQGTQTESFDVRFPLGADDGYCDVQTIEEFSAWVDGAAAEVEVYDEPSGTWCGEQPIPWAHWPVTFPPAQSVEIGVGYTLRPFYNMSGPWQIYLYILETGAGWYGPIGEGTVTVRLPYDVNEYNTMLNEYYPLPNTYSVSDADIVWQFSDLEPTGQDNVQAVVMEPTAWRAYVAARAEVEANPDSIDAHLRLTRVISDIIVDRHGMVGESPQDIEMAELAIASYRRALELAPNNVDIHIAYLDLLLAMWFPWADDPPPADLLPALEHALELDPDNARLIEIWDYVYSFDLTPPPSRMPDPSATPRPTATPRPAEPSPALTMQPTATMTPQRVTEDTLTVPSATPTAPPGGGVQMGPGLIALVMLALVLVGGAATWLWSRRT